MADPDFQTPNPEWLSDLRARIESAKSAGKGVRLSAKEAKAVDHAFYILGQHFGGAWMLPSWMGDGNG